MVASVDVIGPRRNEFNKPSDTNFHAMVNGSDAIPTLVQMLIVNGTGGAVAATIRINDGTTDWDIWIESIPANSSVEREFLIPLTNGRTLSVKSATGSALTFTAALVEYGSKFRGRPS